MNKTFLTLSIICATAFGSMAQTSLEEIKANPAKAGGIYYAYPVSESLNTAPPKGYEPFYISHYARHGSRYLIGDRDYITVAERFAHADSCGALTPLGKDVYARLQRLVPVVKGRGGDLTALGARQHRGIADRMYKAFPQVFAGNPECTAKSTIVMRCAMSMCSFAEGLKENNPSIVIPREASEANMYYLNYHSPRSNYYTRQGGVWFEENRKFKQAMTRPDRLMKSLFSDSVYVYKNVNPEDLMWGLYWVAVDMQDMEWDEQFFDIFEPEELFDLWRSFNYSFYVCNSNHPSAQGLLLENTKPLLTNILEGADSHIARGVNGGDFRFGHDGNLIPLAAMLHLENCHGCEGDPYKVHEVYSDFKISPMAGNVQIVFFRPSKKQISPDNVLVKFMLNEREVKVDGLKAAEGPFYRWTDVRDFWTRLLDAPAERLVNFNESEQSHFMTNMD